ncbi:SMI1/KNR4 family protein [Nonomuraea maritima]|uniref:SMI1/KNR4 family protein n=1 Tax=Nonomuraea maritima TaxID=683260 RepID=UPI000B87BE6B|nr:SMI1/KNR4 family protein [Nonomuraea maritima]
MLALVAAAVVAALAASAVRSRRTPASAGRHPALAARFRRRPAAARRVGVVPAAVPAAAPPEAPPRWPERPILGTPTAKDLERYATRSPLLESLASPSPRPPRKPVDEATRRRLTRWGGVALAVVLLAAGTQVMESAVFSHPEQTRTEAAVYPSIGADYGTSTESLGEESSEMLSDTDCRPERVPARVRKVPPKVTRAVNRQWRRIEGWLRKNAPRTHRTLGRPARPRTIAAAEAATGRRFPDDLRASLLRHDGSVDVQDARYFGFLGTAPLSASTIAASWLEMCAFHDAIGDGDPGSVGWDGSMLPVGYGETSNYLVIDLVHKKVGEIDLEDSMESEPGGIRIRSYYALLKATADAMETGGSVGYWQPGVLNGELDWKIVQ